MGPAVVQPLHDDDHDGFGYRLLAMPNTVVFLLLLGGTAFVMRRFVRSRPVRLILLGGVSLYIFLEVWLWSATISGIDMKWSLGHTFGVVVLATAALALGWTLAVLVRRRRTPPDPLRKGTARRWPSSSA